MQDSQPTLPEDVGLSMEHTSNILPHQLVPRLAGCTFFCIDQMTDG